MYIYIYTYIVYIYIHIYIYICICLLMAQIPYKQQGVFLCLGLGWGGVASERHCTCVLMHFHTYVMLRCCVFSCTSAHKLCYTAVFSNTLPHTSTSMSHYTVVCSHALPHIHHSKLLCFFMHFHIYVMGWGMNALSRRSNVATSPIYICRY